MLKLWNILQWMEMPCFLFLDAHWHIKVGTNQDWAIFLNWTLTKRGWLDHLLPNILKEFIEIKYRSQTIKLHEFYNVTTFNIYQFFCQWTLQLGHLYPVLTCTLAQPQLLGLFSVSIQIEWGFFLLEMAKLLKLDHSMI